MSDDTHDTATIGPSPYWIYVDLERTTGAFNSPYFRGEYISYPLRFDSSKWKKEYLGEWIDKPKVCKYGKI